MPLLSLDPLDRCRAGSGEVLERFVDRLLHERLARRRISLDGQLESQLRGDPSQTHHRGAHQRDHRGLELRHRRQLAPAHPVFERLGVRLLSGEAGALVREIGAAVLGGMARRDGA